MLQIETLVDTVSTSGKSYSTSNLEKMSSALAFIFQGCTELTRANLEGGGPFSVFGNVSP